MDEYLPIKSESSSVNAVIKNAQDTAIESLKTNKDLNKIVSNQINEKAKQEVFKEEINIQKQKYENEYNAYELKKKKEQLDYRVKLEKKLIKREVFADVKVKEMEITLKRYGYLSYVKDSNGDVVLDDKGQPKIDMTDFTPNRFSNRIKEFAHTYSKLSQTTRKIIGTSIKMVFVLGGLFLAGWLGWKYIVPILQALPQV